MTSFTEITSDRRTWLAILLVSLVFLAFSVYEADFLYIAAFSLWSIVSLHHFQDLKERDSS